MFNLAHVGLTLTVLIILGAGAYFAYRRGIAKAIADVESAFTTAADDVKATVAKVKAKL